jgi:pimeloyl-ACP methyl ester carboxylesterase
MAEKTNLVLVPGLLCSPALWTPQVAALRDIADITIADHTRHDTMQGIADAILAKAPERFALAGLSMGGYIAQQIVLQAPERVTRLALLDTGARADTPERIERRMQLNELARREGAGRVQEEIMPLLICKERLADKAYTDLIVQMAVDTGTEAFLRQHAALMARRDNRPLLPTITCPTMVLVGRQDILTPPELSEEIAAAIPDARLELIEDSGHLSTLEQPDAVNRALRRWLR